MNHAGEITPLTRMVRPHAVAITTVGRSTSRTSPNGEAGVARAKAEIFEGLEPGGAAVLNADNRWFGDLDAGAAGAGARVLRLRQRGEVRRARLTGFTPQGTARGWRREILGRPMAFSLRQSAPHWGPMSLCGPADDGGELGRSSGDRPGGARRRSSLWRAWRGAAPSVGGWRRHARRRELQRQPGVRGLGPAGARRPARRRPTHRRAHRHAGARAGRRSRAQRVWRARSRPAESTPCSARGR